MKGKTKPMALLLLSILAPTAIGIGVFCWANSALAETAPHIIINEIQTAGISDKNEFVELFNPTNEPISLDGFKLSKKTKTGSESALLSPSKFSGTIEARGYFLIANPTYRDDILADLSFSGSSYYISNDNTVLLYDKNGALLDKAGFGSASDFETAPAPNPDSNQSIERTDFIDTGNNAVDFSINISPSPKNSSITEGNDEESQSDVENIDDDSQDTPGACAALSSNIKLNEIFPYPSAGEEFIELYNPNGFCVDLSDWALFDENLEKNGGTGKKIGASIEAGSYLKVSQDIFKFSLNNDGDTVILKNPDGEEIDRVSYSKDGKEDYSYALYGGIFQWTSTPTPGAENIFDATKDDENSIDTSPEDTDTAGNTEITATENVFLNEIFPNPKSDSDGEYIEIVNGESGPVDLHGWWLKDASKSKGYQFKDHTLLNPGEYLAIYKPESKIALNNSAESVYLRNSQGDVTSSVLYDKSQKNASYNFDGKSWRWSKYLTPGKKNKFDSEPSVKIKKPKRVFKDIFAEFSAKAEDKETKNLKYVWDFGDGKKSYLAKTSHKYLATGKYAVTLSVTDDSQTIEKKFTLNVKKCPRPDLEMVKIVPNPAGNDSDRETVDIKNNSGGKFNLANWKIVTGSDGKMNNHLIGSEISLEPNETKTITREICKFSLNNKAGKIQLVMPDGKVIDEVEYAKEKIADDEAYVKMSDGWRWIAPNAPAETGDSEEMGDSEDTQDEKFEEQPDGEILGTADENAPYHAPLETSYTSEDEFIFLKLFGLLEYKPQKMNFCPVNESFNTLAYL